MGRRGGFHTAGPSKRNLPPEPPEFLFAFLCVFAPLRAVLFRRLRLSPILAPFTRSTISRMIGSKSASAGLNSVPLITSGAPKTTISAPSSSVWMAWSIERPPTACTGMLTASSTAGRSSSGLRPWIRLRSSKPVWTMMMSTPSSSARRARPGLSGQSMTSHITLPPYFCAIFTCSMMLASCAWPMTTT